MSNSQVARSIRVILSITEPMWAWNGACFGYRRDESLFTYDGVEVGRFVGKEIYGPEGTYLGEVGRAEDGDRLLTSAYKKSRRADAFVPAVESGYARGAGRWAEPLFCGFEDFPPPESLKAAVLQFRHQSRSVT